jgi:hypothetical protein
MNLISKVHRDHGGLDCFAKEPNATNGLLMERGVLRRFCAAR